MRQSTLLQVQVHTESLARQYDLRERAELLGWPARQVVVVDEDLGRSGASTAGGDGFSGLVADVGLGRAGIILALEVSRLAGPAPTGTSCWVRHEALRIRVEMEGLHRRAVAAVW